MALCGQAPGASTFNFLDRMTWQMQVTIPASEPNSCDVRINEDVNFESLLAVVDPDFVPTSAPLTIQVYRILAGSCTKSAYGGVLTVAIGECESNTLTDLADPEEGDRFAFTVTADGGAELVTVCLNCNKQRSS